MYARTSFTKQSASLLLLVFGLLLGAAWAQTESVLYSFCARAGQYDCADGQEPMAGLVFDQSGNLYGTTSYGGFDLYPCEDPIGCGTVFKLTPQGKETVLYSFCQQSGCADGAYPSAGLVFDEKGNLYGTASYGGAYTSYCDGNGYGCGVVFKITPEGKETVLYSFCAQEKDGVCSDGANPVGGLVFDQSGNLYGTTYTGGVFSPDWCRDAGCGVAFKITPEGKYRVLYRFCAQEEDVVCADGAGPGAGLVFDRKGNLYGTTVFGGGAHNCTGCGGVVFKLTPKGKETVLYSFCAQSNCVDGKGPRAGLVFDRKGNLYGTTFEGGLYDSRLCSGDGDGCGVVFKLTPKGKETVLHSFCAQTNCTDGASPFAGVVFDQKGNLYGTAPSGGAYNNSDCSSAGCGVVFKLTPQGKETVLYSFCAQNDCADGEEPMAGLVFDQSGNLYGTTSFGGVYNDCYGAGCGVVFKLTP